MSRIIVQEDLDHLQLLTEYGHLALELTEVQPFQSLIFLARDFPERPPYGFCNGKEMLENRLQVKGKTDHSLILVDLRLFRSLSKI